jgi:phage terminase large subunit-like protein
VPGLSRAARIIAFIETLPVTAGPLAGTKLRLRPWQKRFIRAVYKTDKAGNRLIRTAVLSVGRKNGKTQLASCLALAHFVGPESEPRAECYSVATTRFQAGKVFNEMVAIITAVPWLNARINIIRFRKELEDDTTGSTFAVLAADVAPVHGLNPSFVCYDELAQAPSRALYEALGTALGGRVSPLMVVISTQSASDTAPMSELVDYGQRIARGEIVDPHFHLTLYTADPAADPWVYRTWKQANPALGDFRSLEDLKRLAKQAQRMPSAEASFKNLVLNMRVDTTEHFIAPAIWKGCGAPLSLDLKGRRCRAALDLGATKDLTALVLVFGDEASGYDVLPYVWLPGDVQEAEDRDRLPYATWVRGGHLHTFPGKSSTDPKAVALKIAELHGRYHIEALAYDRWRIEDLRRELDDIGCDVELAAFGQGFRDMGPAVDLLERLVAERKLRHANHPLLAMAVTNAKRETDAVGNRKLSKRKSTGRIDPLVALTMALGVTTTPKEREPEYQIFVLNSRRM